MLIRRSLQRIKLSFKVPKRSFASLRDLNSDKIRNVTRLIDIMQEEVK